LSQKWARKRHFGQIKQIYICCWLKKFFLFKNSGIISVRTEDFSLQERQLPILLRKTADLYPFGSLPYRPGIFGLNTRADEIKQIHTVLFLAKVPPKR